MLSDLKYALRQLAKAPGFTVVAVLSLALGIGASTTVLCWVRHVLQRPLPGVVHQEEIHALISNQGGGNISLLDSRDFDALDRVFAGVAVSQITPASLTLDGDPEWTYGQIASANFFTVLGVTPILGRTFLPDEDQSLGGNPVIVLGEQLWRRRFNADPSVIGRVVDLNRHRFTVIGVVPRDFRGTMTGLNCEFWTPISMVREVASWPADYITWRGSRPFHNVVRLKPGVTLPQAQAAIDSLDTHLSHDFARSNQETHHHLVRYADCPYGAQAVLGSVLRLLMAVCFGVLLIVAANVANLLLARAANRQKEIAIRIAAGASRWRLIRMLMIESLLLAGLGGAGGVLLATWMVDGISLFLPPGQIPIALSRSIDGSTLGLTMLLTLATGLVFGLVPAWQASSTRLYESLKEGGRTSAGTSHHRARNLLVISEVALALVLLVGAGLCLKGTQRAHQVDFGFQADGVLIAGLQIGMNGHTEESGKVFYRQLHQRLTELPGVEDAAFASWLPLGLEGCKGSDVTVDGYVRLTGENPTYNYARISPRYFATMQIPLVAGRDFNDADQPDAPAVAIVNEHFARRFWPGQDAVGRTFRSGGRQRTVIGVARAGKYRALDEPAHPFFYLPYAQGVPELDLSICLRTKSDPAAFIETVRQVVRSIDPHVDLWGARPLAVHVQGAFLAQRIASAMLMALGAVAVILAAMGVYGVMAYAVSQRTVEFGVRLALGAPPNDIVARVVRQGLTLGVVGALVGLGLAFPLTRLLSGFLYGVSPFDPAVFIGVTLLLLGTALLACYFPARRATRVDPLAALRAE